MEVSLLGKLHSPFPSMISAFLTRVLQAALATAPRPVPWEGWSQEGPSVFLSEARLSPEYPLQFYGEGRCVSSLTFATRSLASELPLTDPDPEIKPVSPSNYLPHFRRPRQSQSSPRPPSPAGTLDPPERHTPPRCPERLFQSPRQI